MFTADMAIQNFVGDSFRGATWVSIHNGGGVGWGEVTNGGFGLVIDGTDVCNDKIESMISWDVNNGISRRSWARNKAANWAISRAMLNNKNLDVTMPNEVDDSLIHDIFHSR
jgi:urocanate hydratase